MKIIQNSIANLAATEILKRKALSGVKISVPSPVDLAWDVCSMTHLETHFPMY
jgi:hypothetical protein